MSIYQQGLDRNPANHQPLTPIGFLQRAAQVHPDKLAIVHGDRRINYAEYWRNARRLASALAQQGIGVGATVSMMCANIPEFLEAHFGVPMTGAVLNALNTRLDAAGLAFILDHAECELLFTDSAYSAVVKEALTLCERKPRVIDIVDPLSDGGELLGEMTYDDFVAQGDDGYIYEPPADEWQALTLNYTSGTTGNPKGVVYSHRGAYLNSLGNLVTWPMANDSVYLWTLPMFHCNGWCFPWSVVAAAATHVCLRQVEVGAVARAMNDHGVTHMCGAPIVLNTILNASDELREQIPPGVKALTAGAPPPAAVIEGIEAMGFEITQVYGLTEVYGPCVVSEWKEQWDEEPSKQRAALKARQGVRYLTQESVDVLDPDTLEPVPADGETIGEIMFRGNTTMKGYLKNPAATEEAFAGGWFHSGDLAVKHPDGYVQIRDRSKDIIISGGENISSVEVEGVLYQHPDILDAAVVAKPDEKWGETPCAFVEPKDGAELSADEVIAFCRDNLARFKCPRAVVFGPLPKTSTGKIQKFLLRERVLSFSECIPA